MTEIKVPVSAPGATKAANETDKLADSLQNVADKHKKVMSEEEKMLKVQASVDKQIKTNSERWKEYAKSTDYARRMQVLGRDEYRRMNGGPGGGGGPGRGGINTSRLAMTATRMIPGAQMAGQLGEALGANNSLRVAAGLGVLGASVATAAVLVRANNKRIEENNAATAERTKQDQALAKSAKAFLDAQGDRAASGLRSIRGASRSILNAEGRQGEGVIKDLLKEGGTDAVKAMAELLKGRGARGRLGGMSGAGLLDEARQVQTITGADLAEILKEMGQGKGKYSREKLVKNLTGVGIDMLGVTGESGRDTELSDLINSLDSRERRINEIEGGRMLDPTLVLPSIDREITNLLDPMSKVIGENNAKIREEIEVRGLLLNAERSWIDWWIEASPKLEATLERLGVRSTAGGAKNEIDTLSKNLR